ncbi:MAG: SPOR domain-containing protein [Saprospiraceae bacterium]|nr:SPOR domain-containing protein [Saprospiraceae bacterium]MCB9324956.1 SPOR domain-containing protein [Lewinellaceae bacterium]
MKRVFIFIPVLLLIVGNLKGQNIRTNEEPLITSMMDKFVEVNRATQFVEGWRIQILATTNREQLESARQRFQYRYPNVPVSWVHSSPHYKLRAGAFSTKLEALRLKYILERDYSGLYLVKDDQIRLEELLSSF